MTVNSGAPSPIDWTSLSPDQVDKLRQAYLGTYRGAHRENPNGDTATGTLPPGIDGELAALLHAQFELAGRRLPGETPIAVYDGDHRGGFGPALQIVTDAADALMDSVTMLLHRLGLPYEAIMNPRFVVRRGPAGELLDIAPGADDATESWIHIQLAPTVGLRALTEAQRILPDVLADSHQVTVDSPAMNARLIGLADALDADSGVALYYGSVDALVDLKGLAEDDIVVDRSKRSITLRVPRPVLTKPNIDESRSTVVAQNVAEIASASKEQSTAIDQISIGLNQIDSVTQQNTANTESSATAAEELSAQARELRALIARFQLSSNHAHIASGYVANVTASAKQRSAPQAKRFGAQANGNGNGNYTSSSLERHTAALDSSEFDRY